MRCVLKRLRFLAESFGAVLINARELPGSAASRTARRRTRLASRGIPPGSSSRVCSERVFDELIRRRKGSHPQPIINQILSWPTERPGPASSEESVLWCCSDITGLLLLMMAKFFHNCQTCSLAKSSCFVIAGSGAWSSGDLDQSITAISRAESEPSLYISSCWFWACFSGRTTLIHGDILFVSHCFSFHFPPVFRSGVYRQAWPTVLPLTCLVFLKISLWYTEQHVSKISVGKYVKFMWKNVPSETHRGISEVMISNATQIWLFHGRLNALIQIFSP